MGGKGELWVGEDTGGGEDGEKKWGERERAAGEEQERGGDGEVRPTALQREVLLSGTGIGKSSPEWDRGW